MKKALVIAACFLMILSRPLLAQDAPALGRFHSCLQFNTMLMQHDTFDVDDTGVGVQLKAYGHLGNNWYLGGEIGAGSNLGLFLRDTTDLTMYEINVKRALPLADHLIFGLGAGLSATKVKIVDHNWLLFYDNPDEEIEDTVFGGQIFADLDLRIGVVLLGMSMKETVTQDLEDYAASDDSRSGWDMSNFSIGLHAGFLFR